MKRWLTGIIAFSIVCVTLPHSVFAYPFGGMIGQIIFCYNNAIYAAVGPPRGGPFIWTPSTRTYQFGPPQRVGQWVLGLAAPPYYCLVSIQPVIVFSGVLMTMVGSSGPAAPRPPSPNVQQCLASNVTSKTAPPSGQSWNYAQFSSGEQYDAEITRMKNQFATCIGSGGSSIQSYEKAHPNQTAILTDFVQDRDNPQKIAAMKQLGADLQAVGNSIETIGDIPPQMSTAGPTLANAYRELGRNLAIVPDAKGDEALVKAILTYNKSAEDFVQKFVTVALIFQANDVKFTQDEPGGVFMFPGN